MKKLLLLFLLAVNLPWAGFSEDLSAEKMEKLESIFGGGLQDLILAENNEQDVYKRIGYFYQLSKKIMLTLIQKNPDYLNCRGFVNYKLISLPVKKINEKNAREIFFQYSLPKKTPKQTKKTAYCYLLPLQIKAMWAGGIKTNFFIH